MSIVRLEALRALQCVLVDEIPELEGKVCVGIGAPGHALSFPSMAMTPFKFTYAPYQASELATLSPDKVVMDVGIHEVSLQLRITTKTSLERYALEQKIVDVFLSRPLSPGIIVTPLSGCLLLEEFHAVWSLDNTEWEDGKALEQVYESTITVTGEIPALVTRLEAYPIAHLQLALTEDFQSAAPVPFASSPTFDVVEAKSDGSIASVT